ncbi:zinc-binding dehydrogenase [Enterococcus sp. 669A]|uniref:Zinc-binding dehydrogenase n=1 Tax=Candidatus Enterococcus moelleringii TaxID=2815325 RepID=A0ABS3L9H6_9ENTE|nr:zinc-binding dehydrogenase [Enterococcus sp. 669A]MBO1305718.1 zinc-binding dehydrogenase [Enterococcus sp. 669A]
MKAIVVYEAGGPEKLVYTEVPTPKVKPGWSLIQVKGFGINHSEIFTRQGLSPSVQFPRILGIEAVGVIAETSDETKLPVGQKVISIMGEMGRDFDGGYGEYVLLPNEQIYPVTTDLSWEELTAVPETFYTAFGSMLRLKINAADKVLVRGGTSGVGIAFLKLLRGKFATIEVDGTSRNLEKVDALLAAGFSDVVIDRDGQLQTEKKYDKILELVGPATIKDSFTHILPEGIVCSTGQLGGKWYLEEFDPIIDSNGGYLTGFYSNDVSSAQINQLLDYLAAYQINVKPEKIFSLKDTQKAHEYLESSRSFGKVVVMND